MVNPNKFFKQNIKRPAIIHTFNKKVINSRLTTLFMFQQPVGYTAVSRYHKNSIIGIPTISLPDDYIFQNISEF